MRDIYRDTITEIPPNLLGESDWDFVAAVYSDAMSWFLGKSLQEPSERDYVTKPGSGSGEDTEGLWLWGADFTSFAAPLIAVIDDAQAVKYRNVHLRLRRTYRTSNRARQVASMITQLEVQRTRLLSSLSQLASSIP
jgi:hypothetical protein